MSTIKCTNINALAGSGPPDNLLPITCSAWVNFNGTGVVAIRDSYNVSSITDNGVGDQTVNYAIPLANDDYSWTVGSSLNRWITLQNTGSSATVGSIRLRTVGNDIVTVQDPEMACVTVFGGQ